MKTTDSHFIIMFSDKRGNLAGTVWTDGLDPAGKRSGGFGNITRSIVHDNSARLYRAFAIRIGPRSKIETYDVLAAPNDGSFSGAINVAEENINPDFFT